MGGKWSNRRRVVEDCLTLDVDLLLRRRSISPGHLSIGTVEWTGGTRGTFTVEFECMNARVFRVRYQIGMGGCANCGGSGGPVFDYEIPLTSTETRPFGGRQHWFLCPAQVRRGLPREDGSPNICGRRVGKLYLPPGESQFACRRCHDLTYRSCQESHCEKGDLRQGFGARLDGYI